MKRLLILLAFLVFPSLVHAREGWRDWCQMGNRNVVTSGLNSTTKVQQSFPQCTITIYVHGGGKAKIYNDNNGTEKANPFTSDLDGQFIWYADNGRYDQTTTSAGMPQPITMSDILLCDPADAAGGSCGTATGSGCSLSGVDTGVLSEHPVGTCYDSLDFTWDDGASKQNLQVGDGTNVITANQLTFTSGKANHLTNIYEGWVNGDGNTVSSDVALSFDVEDIFLMGVLHSAVATGVLGDGSGSTMSDIHAWGRSASISATANGTMTDIMCLMAGCAGGVAAATGGNVDTSFVVGSNDSLNSTGANSNTSSIYSIGEGNFAQSSSGSNTQNSFQLGETDHLASSAASSTINGAVQLGYNQSVTSNGGHQTFFVYQLGDHGNITSSSTNVSEAFQIGNTLNITDCAHCYQIGENATNSGTSNIMTIGLSSTPELSITAAKIALGGHLNQSATKQFAGTCAMSAGTSCTFTLLAAFSSGPVCISGVQSATLTGGVSSCTVSGTTVTITANSANSLTWGAILIGNPN